ncbi:retrovirus-related pol polyprotein from transposon TNT 1-94 [Tanacetum coccineum]
MAGSQDDIPPPPPPPPPPQSQTPTQQTPDTISTMKLPILKKGEYGIWAMKMEHYLAHADYPIWEVIQNGNGPVSITTDTQGQIKVLPPRTTEEISARERERKARTTLLMALPEDHLAKFHKMTDAKEMWDAIKSRCFGNDESKKMQKYILKQQFEGFSVSNSEGLHKGYDMFQSLLSQLEIHGAGVSTEDANQKFLRSLPSAWSQVSLIMRTKPGVDSLSFDDLYNNLRVFKNDSGNKDRRRSGKQEDSKALVTIDGKGVDWTGHSKEEEDFALMACNGSGSDREVQSCSNECVASYNKLKKLCDLEECRTKEFKDSRGRYAWNSGNKDGRRSGKQEDSKALVTIDGEVDVSRHITGNKAYLAEYQDFNDGPVAFGELQHFNLFSVSQICHKKNKVLFTESKCLVLSLEFKLPDENQVLLRIPRQNNMYSFNLENIVPSKGLACLIVKAITDESNKWHRRLGHVNFKNLNKLVKGNLTSPLVDDDLDEEEEIKVTEKKNLENDIVDETLEIDEIVNIKESRNHPLENVIGNLNQRTLRSQAQNQSNFFCFISTIEPKNVNEALTNDSWIVAMQEELNQFIANDVWELVPQPRNMTIIGTKWVFRNKLDENGIVSRNKARLVAQGYNQQEGIDYDETYAPVARLESIRILLAYACALDFKLFQMDVKSAFLNDFINEDIYVTQPPGFIDFEKPDHVY